MFHHKVRMLATLLAPFLIGAKASAQAENAPLAAGLLEPNGWGINCGVGKGRPLGPPDFLGQCGVTKEKLLLANGGNDETEAAVAKALMWIAKQQNVGEGSWEFDGTLKHDRIGATGLALMPFLAAGETHRTGKKFKQTVERGLRFLTDRQTTDGDFGDGVLMDSHAITTIALCEAAGMTRDASLNHSARLAVNYIIKAQGKSGSWGLKPDQEGDLHITGWQLHALRSAKVADIPVPAEVMARASEFLNRVSPRPATTYGPRDRKIDRTTMAVGLLARFHIGESQRHPSIVKGADWLLKEHPPVASEFDIYYLHHATQFMQRFDGPAWHRDWNPLMQKVVLERQITERVAGARALNIGSWPKEGAFGQSCGKLGTTALACLTSEAYYRYLPIYKRDDGGLASLEKGDGLEAGK